MSQSVSSPSPSKKGALRSFLIGNACIGIATLFWALNVPADKALIPSWISGSQLGVVRIVGAAILVWITSLFVKNARVERRDWLTLAICGVMLFVFLILMSISYKYTSPVDISIIMTTPPLMVMVIRRIFEKVHASRAEWWGMWIAFGGAIFIILMSGSDSDAHARDRLLGDLLMLASCVGYAVYLSMVEGPSKRYKPINLTRWVDLAASICCIPWLFTIADQPVFTHVGQAWWPLLLLGLIVLLPSYAAYLFVPPALKHIGSDVVSMYQYLIPIIATIASIAVGLADFHWYQPVSLAIILVGVYIANKAKFTQRH